MELRRIVLLLAFGSAAAFAPSNTSPSLAAIQRSQLQMGFFDDLKTVFGEEGRKARAEKEEQIKREQEEAQREIYERRNNPELMEEYEANVKVRRQGYGSLKTDLEKQQDSFYVDE